VKNAPEKEQMENFWKEIYGKKVQHNEAACWIKNQYQRNPGIEWRSRRGTKGNAKVESPWKRPNKKCLA
jgi:hypothetical protein